MNILKRLKVDLKYYRVARIEMVLTLIVFVVFFTGQASAVVRFTNRSLYINSAVPGATTSYTVSFQYTTPTSIGSLKLQACLDPIPYDPCVPPTGINLSNADLASQVGETGYSISSASSNQLILSRTPSVVVPDTQSTYVFNNIVNPTDTSQSFSIRLSDYASTDASGSIVDLGSILSEITNSITIQSQVPPMLIFCTGQQVSADCTTTTGNNYQNLGNLDPSQTLTTESQMAAGTNASSGYVITVNGNPMESGNYVINPLATPTASKPGTNQFGINLVANTNPTVGSDPEYFDTGSAVANNYDQPNLYTYNDGDAVAGAPHVSLISRYTISYIVNSSTDLHPGIYSTTLTYICTGKF